MNKKVLNHYNKLNVIQFVTFRTHDSVDDYLHRVNQTPDLSIS
ncbi:hypothetical protein [Methyloprofundus sedimenti]|nr:hypothetical protein [Methyloprofundus sedimenti]